MSKNQGWIGHFVIVELDTWASSVQKVSKNDSELVISKIADKLPKIGFLSAFFWFVWGNSGNVAVLDGSSTAIRHAGSLEFWHYAPRAGRQSRSHNNQKITILKRLNKINSYTDVS